MVDRSMRRSTWQVIDAHAQLWDPWTVPLEVVQGQTPVTSMSAEELLAHAEAAGVGRVIQVTPAWMGEDNSFGLAGAARHPGAMSILARIDPSRPDLEARLAQWRADPAVAGVHVSSSLGQPQLTDAAHSRLWDGCAAVGLPVSIDALGATAEIAVIASQHPGLQILIDHAGMREGVLEPHGWDALLDLGAFSNVAVKVSLLPQASGERRPGRSAARAVESLIWAFGSHRLLWGSNFPACRSVCDYEEALDAIAGCPTLWDGDKELILGGNWARMFDAVLV